MMRAINRTRNNCLAETVRVADSHRSRLVGLMGACVESFPPGNGLLITPCQGIHSFFMRFPIDALYLNSAGQVVHAVGGLKPWRIGPFKWLTASVLELPAGTIERSGTERGDNIEISS
jgi:uncharacterized membrane protein (UPF0127 family)